MRFWRFQLACRDTSECADLPTGKLPQTSSLRASAARPPASQFLVITHGCELSSGITSDFRRTWPHRSPLWKSRHTRSGN
jgi:hypothetical protein